MLDKSHLCRVQFSYSNSGSCSRLLHRRFCILSMMLQGFYVKLFEKRRKRNRNTSFVHAIETNKDKGRWSYHFNKREQTSTMLEQLKKPNFPFDTEISFRQTEILEIVLTDKKFSRSVKCCNEADAGQTMPTPDLWKGNITSNLKQDVSVLHLCCTSSHKTEGKQSLALLSFWMLWLFHLFHVEESVHCI